MSDAAQRVQSVRLAALACCLRSRPAIAPNCTKPLIVILVPSQDNPFFKAEADAAAARALALGYRVRVDAHDDDAYRQDNLIDAAIASNAAAIILDNAGADSSIAAVRRATRAGIPCFLIDREIEADGIAKAQIIADNDQGAQIVAAEFVRALGTSRRRIRGIAGPRIRYQCAGADARAFTPFLTGNPALKRVAAQSANWSQSEAFQKTETILQAHADIARHHRRQRHHGAGRGGRGQVVGAEGHRRYRIRRQPRCHCGDSQSAGSAATTLQPAVLIARLAVDEANQFLKTGTTGKPERQVIPCDLVTQSNADDYGEFEKVR